MRIIRISSLWCSSCLVTNKYYEELKKKYPNLEYIEYDYDMDEEVKQYNVKDILPVVILFKDNVEITRIVGENNLNELEKIIGEV